jgi:anti-anti-sigma regulatory factor
VNLRIENLEGEDGAVRVALKKMKFGAGTRQSGNFVRVYTANLLNETTAPIVVDFTDVGIVSSSFADEFIAKLYAQMGAEGFNQRIRLHGMNETNTVIVRNALALRITDS